MANTHSLQLTRASSQYAQAADSSALSVTGDLTMECWVKCTTLPGSGIGCPMIFKGDYNTNNSYQLYYLNNGGTPQIVCTIFSGAGNANYCSSAFNYTLTIGTWFHVAMVVTVANAIGSKFELFINGVSQGNGSTSVTGTAPTSIYNGSTELGIGMCGNPIFLLTTYCFDGKFDEVRVWNVARTGAQIAANYQTELTGSESGLVGYWKMNNSNADSTSNANSLTIYGSAPYSTDIPTWVTKVFTKIINVATAIRRASQY